MIDAKQSTQFYYYIKAQTPYPPLAVFLYWLGLGDGCSISGRIVFHKTNFMDTDKRDKYARCGN